MNKEKNNNLKKWYKISVLTLLVMILALSFITLYIVFIGYVFSFGAPECIEGQVEYCGTEIECNDVSGYWCQDRYVTDDGRHYVDLSCSDSICCTENHYQRCITKEECDVVGGKWNIIQAHSISKDNDLLSNEKGEFAYCTSKIPYNGEDI